jgi:DNA-binding transcriptional regulator YiaG
MTVPSMTPAEFNAALARLGLNKDGSAAARVLGCTPRAVRFWRQGQRKVPGPVVVLLQVLQSMLL